MSNTFHSSELLCLYPKGSLGYEEWLITLPSYLRETIKNDPKSKTFQISPIETPDDLRTDKKYWRLVLRSHGLGMNRGTEKRTSLEEEKLAKEIEDSRLIAKAKLGRPAKEVSCPFSRASVSGYNSFFGTVRFRCYDSKPHAIGAHPSARQNSKGDKGDKGMLIYIGGMANLERLEESQVRAESGRVTPPGASPRVDA
jgi:hypothetical protein